MMRYDDNTRMFAEQVKYSISSSSGELSTMRLIRPDRTFVVLNIAGGTVDITQKGSYVVRVDGGSTNAYVLRIGGITKQVSGYGRIKNIVFTYAELFPSQSASVSQKPRYQIISPNIRGSVTESVRELDPNQVASLRLRGYQVHQTTLGISSQVKSSVSNRLQQTYSRLPGIKNKRVIGNDIILMDRKSVRTINHKSRSNPRRMFNEDRVQHNVFSEDGYALVIYHINGKYVGTIQPLSIAQVRQYRIDYGRSGLYKTKIQRISSTSGKKVVTATTPSTTTRPRFVPVYRPGPTGGDDSHVRDSSGNVADVTKRLMDLQKYIDEVNERTARQLIDLGGSTTDRSNETKALDVRLKEINDRISTQLEALGSSVSDVSKALEAAKAEKLIKDVENGLPGAGGVLGFLSGNNILPIALIGIVLLVMMRK